MVQSRYRSYIVTAQDGSFDVVVPPGKTGKTMFRKAKKANFYCRYHPGMTGGIDSRPK